MIRYHEPFMLSDRGSDRGTSYRFTNKSLTLAGKTHVVWTDAVAVTQGRTFDHASGEWGQTITLGEGTDNHNSPTLTADSAGHLHVMYGPHGVWGYYPDPTSWPAGTFKSARASGPGGFEGMDQLGYPVGYRATYACLLITKDDQRVLVYRGGEHPPSAFFQTTTPQGGWTQAKELARQDIKPGYTHYGAQIAIDDEGTYYVGFHYYSGGDYNSLGAGVLKSVDGGLTWSDLRGGPVVLPARYHDAIAIPQHEGELDPRFNGIAIDSRRRVWTLSTGQTVQCRGTILGCFDPGSGQWTSMDVSEHLPGDRTPFQADMTIDSSDRIHVAVAAPLTDAVNAEGGNPWGHATCEVFHMVSADGGRTFDVKHMDGHDPAVPTWTPNLSKPGPHHPVDTPVLMYTHGFNNVNGDQGGHTTGHTRVYCVRMEMD